VTEDSVAAIALFISRKTETNASVFITCRAIGLATAELVAPMERASLHPSLKLWRTSARPTGGSERSKLKYRLYDYRRARGQTVDAVYDTDVSGLRAE